MGLSVGNVILASDFNLIKARVKAECARRKYVGSIASYASEEYDYTITPIPGENVLPEHWNKIVIPMNQISDTGFTVKESGDVVPSLLALSNLLGQFESERTDGTVSSCRSTCTGLCVGACSSGCMGCTGGCASTCAQSCTGGCSSCTSCSGSCQSGCSGTCRGGCSTCAHACASACSTYMQRDLEQV